MALHSLIGMAGLVTSDNILGRKDSEQLRRRFEQALEEDFTECDGRIVPFRSELTGLAVSIAQHHGRRRV
jgi:hypothetical protein